MKSEFQSYDFPKQRIPNSEKDDKWAALCCDWIIAAGNNNYDDGEIEKAYNMIQGIFPEDTYKKILNPYNSTNEKYTRFPATLRHYDMLKGILRRYVGEYVRSPHHFIVGANNPEVVFAKNAKLREEVNKLIQQQIALKVQQALADWINQGQDPKQFNPQQAIDIEAFTKKFNEDYIDNISEQGQHLLSVIQDITEDELLYARAYFDFVAIGRFFTYTEVNGETLTKRNISARDARPIRTDQYFVEDDDMFCYVRKLTYQQIADEFQEYFDDKDKQFIDRYYAMGSANISATYAFNVYESYFPEVCDKFSNKERQTFKDTKVMSRDNNSGLYDVWHVFWRGEVRQALVEFVNASGFIDTRIEEDGYELDTSKGDLSIEYIYQPQVYESVRIGGRNDAIYPYGARAINYNRNGKLPVNGVTELLPGMGEFSIVKIIAPHNIFYDIVAYHREMALAKNKLSILMIAKSLLGKVPEKTIYKMLADGVLYYDDEDDAAALRAQQVRMLQSSNIEYLAQLTNLLKDIEQTAKDAVDMTPQRYGDIANSAGKGTTQEAIVRGSMGSVIIEFVMDYARERDYARDMDFSKFAWIDGLNTSYRSEDGSLKYISLDVDAHNFANYLIKARSSIKEKEKFDQYRQLAFSFAQNGDAMMATAAIEGDNVATISKMIKKFNDDKNAHDERLKQLEIQAQQIAQDTEIKKIQTKGEEDRKTKELEGYLDSQIELIKADANMVSFDNGVSTADKDAGMNRLQQQRNNLDKEKIDLDKQKTTLEAYNKYADRQLKEKDMENKLAIAKENRNRYDIKRRSKS